MPPRRKSRSSSPRRSPRRVLKRRSSGKARTSRRHAVTRRSPKRTYKGTDIRYQSAASLPAPESGQDDQIVPISTKSLEDWYRDQKRIEERIIEHEQEIRELEIEQNATEECIFDLEKQIRDLKSDEKTTEELRDLRSEQEIIQPRLELLTQLRDSYMRQVKLIRKLVKGHPDTKQPLEVI